MQPVVSIILPLGHINDLFNAPDANPFSTREVDILGQAGMDCIKKRVIRLWPRRPTAVHVTLQLPADQITPGLTELTRRAVHHFCTNKIASNRLQRGLVNQRARRQFTGALLGTLIALAVIAILSINPLRFLPDILRGILTIFASFAIAILIFNALWSLVFDWVPFVQDNTLYTVLMDMDLVIEAQPDEEAAGKVQSHAG